MPVEMLRPSSKLERKQPSASERKRQEFYEALSQHQALDKKYSAAKDGDLKEKLLGEINTLEDAKLAPVLRAMSETALSSADLVKRVLAYDPEDINGIALEITRDMIKNSQAATNLEGQEEYLAGILAGQSEYLESKVGQLRFANAK